MDKTMRAELKNLLINAEEAADRLKEVHDQHVWEPEDPNHPKEGCSVCNTERDLRVSIQKVKKLLRRAS